MHGPLAIDVYRVNDYDLQIQHNEAVGLACELLGVQRSRSDAYFDGTRGKQLVKITPFNHPLSPLDLEVLQQELKSRPDEDRNILIVCLGMELAAKRAIDEWNVHRKGGSGINRIEVIELRSDPKYGRFIAHAPAQAKVTIARKKDARHYHRRLRLAHHRRALAAAGRRAAAAHRRLARHGRQRDDRPGVRRHRV